MIYNSETPVFCRCCGKPIRKYTRWTWVKKERTVHDRPDYFNYHYGTLRSKAECDAVTSDHVVSVQYGNDSVVRFSTWDGNSYVDRYFCTNKCAIRLAHLAAAEGLSMPAYKKRLQNTPRVGGGRRVAL